MKKLPAQNERRSCSFTSKFLFFVKEFIESEFCIGFICAAPKD
jgi:hypothetical protein